MAKKLHLLYGLILLCFFLAACATPGDQDEFEGELVNYVSSSCGLSRLFSRIKLSNTVLVRYGNSMLEVPQSLLMLSSRQNESTDKIFSHRKICFHPWPWRIVKRTYTWYRSDAESLFAFYGFSLVFCFSKAENKLFHWFLHQNQLR